MNSKVNVNESKVLSILNQISHLTLEDMLVLNKGLVQMINQKSRLSHLEASMKFTPGQIIKFTKLGRGRDAGTHFIKIEGFNRAGTAVKGYPVHPTSYEKIPGPSWTVSTTSCTLVK